MLETRIPDLYAWSKSDYIVCDVAVIKDTMGLNRIHEFKAERVDHSSHIELEGQSLGSPGIFGKHMKLQENFSCGCQLDRIAGDNYCRSPTRSESSSSTAAGEDTEEETKH